MHTGPLSPAILGTPGIAQPTTGLTVGDSLTGATVDGGAAGVGGFAGSGAPSGFGGLGGFGLREPPKMRRALTGQNKGGEAAQPPPQAAPAPTGDSGISSQLAQTKMMDSESEAAEHADGHRQLQHGLAQAASAVQPSGIAAQQHQQQQQQQHQGHNPDRAPKGTLRIKIVSARNLAVTAPTPEDAAADSSGRPEPYVVIQFEQNEFVSRPAQPPASPSQTPAIGGSPNPGGKANIPRNNSYGPSLGIGSISRAFADAARRNKSNKGTPSGSGATTPKNEGAPGGASSWLGKGNPMTDPVWKEEVSL